MAAKKAPKRGRTTGARRPTKGPENGDLSSAGTEAVQAIMAALSNHESAIRQLAQVVVNLHANVGALREMADALAEGASGARLARARKRLRRVTLDE